MRKALAPIVGIVSTPDLLFYKFIFCLVAGFILFLLCDWSKTSMQTEYISFNPRGRGDYGFIDASLKNGTKLVAGDFLRGLEVLSFESGVPRVRFISNLFLLLNVKLRVWLWNYFPPHPSFSLTWVFSLILSPIYLYRLIWNLTHDQRAGWIGLSIYFISIGFLSGILLLFHPAKPLTNFLAILSFYFFSRIIPSARQEQHLRRKIDRASLLIPYPPSSPIASGCGQFREERLPSEGSFRLNEYERWRVAYSRKAWRAFLAAITVMCLGFFTDETAWFLFFIVPVLFPAIFVLKGKGAYFALIYAAVMYAFVLFLTFGAPPLLRMYGFDDFDFWKWVVSPYASPEAGKFALKNVALQGYNFLTEHVIVFHGGSPFVRPSRSCLPHLAFLGYFGFLFTRLPKDKRWLCLRILLSLAVFLVCQTAMLAKHLVVVPSAWYYGAMFPIFFALLCAVVLSQQKGWLRLINTIVFVILLCVSASYALHPRSANLGLSYKAMLEAWKERGNGAALSKMRLSYPNGTGWLFLELRYADVPSEDRGGIAGLIEKAAFYIADRQSSDNPQ